MKPLPTPPGWIERIPIRVYIRLFVVGYKNTLKMLVLLLHFSTSVSRNFFSACKTSFSACKDSFYDFNFAESILSSRRSPFAVKSSISLFLRKRSALNAPIVRSLTRLQLANINSTRRPYSPGAHEKATSPKVRIVAKLAPC